MKFNPQPKPEKMDKTFIKLNKKELKEKTCVYGHKFVPKNSFQKCDIIECCIRQAKDKSAEKEARKSATEKKVWHLKNDKTSVFESKLQIEINAIARAIDFGQPCIATFSLSGKMNGGHYISVGSNSTIRYNLHNIHIQSEHSNKWKSGDTIRYQDGIVKVYGQKYLDFMNSLKSTEPIKLGKDRIIELIPIAKKIRKSIEEKQLQLSHKQRIILRNEVNETLSIYTNNYQL